MTECATLPPVPVLVVNDPTLLEIVAQFVIPVLSLIVAIVATWAAVKAIRQAQASDKRARESVEAQGRSRYADRLRDYARSLRDMNLGLGKPGFNSLTDPWQDLLREAPDDDCPALVVWITNSYGSFEHAHRGQRIQELTQALLNLHGEVEERVRAWENGLGFSNDPPFTSRSWPKPHTGASAGAGNAP